MADNVVWLQFEDLTPAEANRQLAELERWSETNSPGTIYRIKPDDKTQDSGTVLAVVLGSASAVAFFRGLQAFLTKRGSRIKITTPAGVLLAEGDAIKQVDPAAVLKQLLKGPSLTQAAPVDAASGNRSE